MTKVFEEDKLNVLDNNSLVSQDDGDQESSSQARGVSNAYMKKDKKKAGVPETAAPKQGGDPNVVAHNDSVSASGDTADQALFALSAQFHDWNARMLKIKTEDKAEGPAGAGPGINKIDQYIAEATSHAQRALKLVQAAKDPVKPQNLSGAAARARGGYDAFARGIQEAQSWVNDHQKNSPPRFVFPDLTKAIADITDSTDKDPSKKDTAETKLTKTTITESFAQNIDALEKDVASVEIGNVGDIHRINTHVETLKELAVMHQAEFKASKPKVQGLAKRISDLNSGKVVGGQLGGDLNLLRDIIK